MLSFQTVFQTAKATTSYYVTNYALHVTAMVVQRLEAAYVKCIKMVFGFSRKKQYHWQLTVMFYHCELPIFKTVVYNAKANMDNQWRI